MDLLKVLLGVVVVVAFARIVWMLHVRPSVGEIWGSLNGRGIHYHGLRPDLTSAAPLPKEARLLSAQLLGPTISVIYWRSIKDGSLLETLKVLAAGKRERRLYFVDGKSSQIGGGPTPLDETDAKLSERILQRIHEALPKDLLITTD